MTSNRQALVRSKRVCLCEPFATTECCKNVRRLRFVTPSVTQGNVVQVQHQQYQYVSSMRSVIADHKAQPAQTEHSESMLCGKKKGSTTESNRLRPPKTKLTPHVHPLHFSPYFSEFPVSGFTICPMRPRCGCGEFCWYDL